MASDKDFVQFVADQIEEAGTITFKMMFGDYGIWCDGKVVVLVCDNQVFVKPTAGGRAFIGQVTEAPAYPGAKNSFLLEDQYEDKEWFSTLVRITAQELPEPKPRKKKKVQ